MNQKTIIATTATALITLMMTTGTAIAQTPKEKCFGISKAGQNDCANLSGSHSCAGQSKTDMDKTEWKYVAKGTCNQLKGLTIEEAKSIKK